MMRLLPRFLRRPAPPPRLIPIDPHEQRVLDHLRALRAARRARTDG